MRRYIPTGKPKLTSQPQGVAVQAVHTAAGKHSEGTGEIRKRRIRGKETSKRDHEIQQN